MILLICSITELAKSFTSLVTVATIVTIPAIVLPTATIEFTKAFSNIGTRKVLIKDHKSRRVFSLSLNALMIGSTALALAS